MISAVVNGSLGADAERKALPSGDMVVSFRLASTRYDSRAKEKVTDWVSCAMFGKRAESLAKYLTKGSRVVVRGQVHVREYEHNGAKRWSLECRADDVELMGDGGGRRDDGPDNLPF